jgi:ATP-dependent exoDNAse (exonuclease V) alpha subunit
MTNYDFSTLSPDDFEKLCRDLLSLDLEIQLKSFTTGRDRGIDLRYAPAPGKHWVVQCKHFANSSYSTLYSHLKTKELPKVQALKPARYILATSVALTPDRADELVALFTPFCTSSNDIYSRSDLNALLGRHSEVHERCFKLWLTSEAVLQRVLRNAAFIRAELRLEDIRRKLKLYVSTPSLDRAHKTLEENHVCVISGIPGIGKTTLAEILLVRYANAGWQLIEVQQNLEEAIEMYRSTSKSRQLFYYDDFLGQISMGDNVARRNIPTHF